MDSNNSPATTIQKVLIIGVSVLLTMLLFFGTKFYLDKGKIVVRIRAIPADSEITINGKRGSSGSKKLVPGNYTFSATRGGFAKAESTITVTKESEDINVRLLLTPVSEKAIKWASDHSDEYQELEAQAGEESAEQGEAFNEKYPITSRLPFKNLLFSINYTTLDTKNGFKILIEASTAKDRQYAIRQIKNWGYDPSDYEIVFTNFNNPLDGV